MSPIKIDPVSDPLFQLNVLLWLTQPLPQGSQIVPILHQRGFAVYAISPALGVPLDLQLAARAAQIAHQSNGRPDVVLTHEEQRKFAFTECKASSFRPDSETAEQARAFLLIAGSRAAEVLGLNPSQVKDSVLGYLVPENQKAGLQTALVTMGSELTSNHLPAARFTILGLQAEGDELNVSIDNVGSVFFSIPAGSHAIMKLQTDTIPRPLYFIPYDPDLNQSEDERLFCKRVLFERIHSGILVAVGRATPPGDLLLKPNDLLNDAMFGMYSLWENRDSATHMRGLCRQLVSALARAVNVEIPESFTYASQTGWKISLPDADRYKRVIDAVSRFSCETMNLRAVPERELFDL